MKNFLSTAAIPVLIALGSILSPWFFLGFVYGVEKSMINAACYYWPEGHYCKENKPK